VGGQTVKGQGDGNEYDQSILYACMRTEKWNPLNYMKRDEGDNKE
jgi:hypothetical protein